MEFRLVYQGLLLSETSNRQMASARATHKHEIRKALHPQLKRLWDINPYLSKAKTEPVPSEVPGRRFGAAKPQNTLTGLVRRFNRFGYNFVPLITQDLGVLCSVDILYLRNGSPGSLLQAGDLDNRLKTLFDGLQVPREANQVGDYAAPSDGEDPFFCLLEDDSLVTRVTVETDTLLAPVTGDANDARVIIKVKTAVSNPDDDTIIGFM